MNRNGAALPLSSRLILWLTALYGLAGGIGSLAGWVFDIRLLTDWIDSGISIQPNASVCVGLASASLLLLAAGHQRFAAALGLCVALIGGLTLFEIITDIRFGFHSLLMFNREWGRIGVIVPGRMGPPGSLCWTLLGTAIVLRASGRTGPVAMALIFALATLTISLISITSYWYGASDLYTLPRLTVIALQTATFIFALSVGLVASAPEREPMRSLLDQSAAGMMARRALPIILLFPLVLGWIRVRGQDVGLFDTAFGSTLSSAGQVVLLAALLWWLLDAVRRHELAERKSAREVVETLESISDGFVTLSRDWRFTYVNSEGERLMGKPRGDLLGRNVWELFPEFAGRASQLELHRAAAERVSLTFEDFNPKSKRWFANKVYPGADGGVAVYFQDITQRKNTEAALQAKERQLQHVTDNAAVLVAQCTRDLRYGFVNKTCAEFIGLPVAEIVGKPLLDVIGPVALASIRPFIDRVLAGERVEFEAEVPYESVGTRWMRAVYVPDRDAGGAVLGWIAAVTDITERRRAEVAVRAGQLQLQAELEDAKVLASASAAIIHEDDIQSLYNKIIDAALALMRADFAGIHLLQTVAGKPEFLQLLACRGLAPPAVDAWQCIRIDAPDSACAMALHSAAGVSIADVEAAPRLMGTDELTVCRKAGIRACQITPLMSRGGSQLGTLSIYWSRPQVPSERSLRLLDILARQAADLVERHQARREREILLESERAARAEAEQMARLKDDFLATVSHELRTPLNAILGWAQLLARARHDEKITADGVAAIISSGRMQAQIIDDLLDMNRIMTGKLRLEVQNVELARVVEDALDTVRPSAEAKSLSIQAALDPAAGPIRGDPVRLQQAVWNLLGNAVKFTPKGGKVEVVLERLNSHVQVSVSDTGIGIKRELLPHVFDRFRQGDSSSTRQHSGLGLGLAIAKQIVELHGGGLSVESDGDGKGATFRIRLPVAIAKSTPERQESDQGAALETTLPGVRILVVDDDHAACEVLRRLLSACEAEVEVAHSGPEALDCIAARPPDILLCDIGMPGMDGYSVVRSVRSKGLTFPAISVTAFARTEDRIRALQEGFNMHLSKPIDARELLAAVARLLRLAPASQEHAL